MFGLYAGTDAADVPELMRVVVDEIGNAAETLNEAEVARAKAQMKAGLLMALESSEARVGQLARQMLAYGRPIPLDEIVAKIDAVTVESARAAGRALIAAQGLRSPRSVPATALKALPRSLKVWFAGQPEPRELADITSMAFFRTVSFTEIIPGIAGEGVALRAPHSGDFAEWAALREPSRDFLAPWEPTWPADDLTRGAFRRRLKRYAEDQRSDLAYAFLDLPQAKTTPWSAG